MTEDNQRTILDNHYKNCLDFWKKQGKDEHKTKRQMIKITMIFGENAVKKYDESKELPSEEWLMDNGGVVDEKEFNTEAEYNAYVAGLNDGDGWTDYHIIRHPNEQEEPESSCEESIWLRAGMTVQGSRQDIEKILAGNVETLQRLLETGSYEINGETYIPSTVIEEYNNEHHTDFDEDEVEFHPCIDKIHGSHIIANNRKGKTEVYAEKLGLSSPPSTREPEYVDDVATLRTEIKELYNQYLEDFETEPSVAVCHIVWVDDQEHEVVKIKLSNYTYPDVEDDIFFYCDSLDELCSLVGPSGEDFDVTGIEYFE